MTSEGLDRVKLSVDSDHTWEADSGGALDVEAKSDSEVEEEERCGIATDGKPGEDAEMKSGIDRKEESVIAARGESVAENQRESEVKAETELHTKHPEELEDETRMTTKLKSDSLSEPVRFQLRTRKRILNSPDRSTLETLTSDPDEGPARLKKPRRVDFPTISEDDFLEVVDAIEKACQDKQWKDAFEMVDFLCARRCDERVMEMKAQLQMEVGENFEAVKNCERAIKLNPRWWEGHRTHGRCLLSIKEFALAKKAFERAIHINPADEDLRSELRSALESENRQ